MAEKLTIDRIDEIMRAVFHQLKTMGGKAKGRDVLDAIAPKIGLSSYEKEKTKTGAIRWETHIRFYTVDCAKAGYLQKSDGNWVLTEKGEKALKLSSGELIRSAQREYRAWKRAQPDAPVEQEEEGKVERQATYEEAIETARTEIEEHINNLGPYEFQKLISELLRAMGYHVPYVASPGPDGGVDIVAYKDPLGTTAPRIKVQVKHRDSKVAAKDVRELEGLLRKEGDIGLIVSSGGFSSEAEREIRSSNKHIETMDLQRVITLWQEHYEALSQSGKALLPLVKVFFLAPAEE
jgi:restriction system protein